MSVFTIDYRDGAKMMRPVNTRQEYLALRGSSVQRLVIDEVRNQGKSERKKQLVQMCYSCLPASSLPDGSGPLKGSTQMSDTVGMDVDLHRDDYTSEDEYQQAMAAIPGKVMAKKEELGLLMLERSATKGYHLVFRRRAELSQVENLQWASKLQGVQFDEGAKDITRVFFTTTSANDDLLYLDDALFSQTPAATPSTTSTSSTPSTTSTTSTPSTPTYQGIPYDKIVAKYWEMFYDGHEPCEGNRNVLTFELALLLRPICDYRLDVLQQVVPNYWGTETAEWNECLQNALKEPRKGMPSRLRQVLAALKEARRIEVTGGNMTTPPPMPKHLPALIKQLTSNVPDYYKPAVASAVFPALAAHLHGTKFRYWDNMEHEATFMNVLVGRQSVGKGCIKKPIEYIMADIMKRDEPNRMREAEWKRQNPSGKTKAKDPRPQDICIQMLIDNLTDAVFNQRIVDADRNGGRFLYTIVDEVEALRKVTSRGSIDEVTLLIRKAFDNSLHGQERVGADSVSGIAPLRWNWNASTTPPNARRFFSKAVNDGTLSRLDVSTIILDEDMDDDPVMGIYDEDFAQELKPYIDRLEAASGLVECPQAKKLALKLKDELKENARLMESDAYRVLGYRANVIAWLKGMVLYVAQGYRWTKEIADFVRWSLQYNMWCKMLYFGRELETEMAAEVEMQRQSGPQNMLALLPAEFTREEYRQLRVKMGKAGDGESTLRTWIARHYIEWDEIAGKFISKRSA